MALSSGDSLGVTIEQPDVYLGTLDPDTSANELGLNDIGVVRLRLSAPLVADDYRRNRTTGSFVLIDEATNATVGAGMISAPGSY